MTFTKEWCIEAAKRDEGEYITAGNPNLHWETTSQSDEPHDIVANIDKLIKNNKHRDIIFKNFKLKDSEDVSRLSSILYTYASNSAPWSIPMTLILSIDTFSVLCKRLLNIEVIDFDKVKYKNIIIEPCPYVSDTRAILYY